MHLLPDSQFGKLCKEIPPKTSFGIRFSWTEVRLIYYEYLSNVISKINMVINWRKWHPRNYRYHETTQSQFYNILFIISHSRNFRCHCLDTWHGATVVHLGAGFVVFVWSLQAGLSGNLWNWKTAEYRKCSNKFGFYRPHR